MDAGSFSAGAAIGGTIIAAFSVWYRTRDGRRIKSLHNALQAQDSAFAAVSSRLVALRNNCFLTNERGHRVRYFKASPERRAKAEQD